MSDNPVIAKIQQEIGDNDVVLFMKGTPMFPQCGVKFKGIDVLQDQGLREGIKSFSNWPTIPQLYVKGEFIGGCDIVREMYQSGELQQLFSDKGVSYAA